MGLLHLFHCQSPQYAAPPPFTILTFPRILPLSILIRLCQKLLGLNLWQPVPPISAKWHTVSSFACSPVLSAIPAARRVVDNCTSFSSLSSSNSSLGLQLGVRSQLSCPQWKSVHRCRHLLPFYAQCTFRSSTNKCVKEAAFWGHLCTHIVTHKHLTSPITVAIGQPEISPVDASFPTPISLDSWQSCQLLADNRW